MGKLIVSWSPIIGKSGATTTTTVLATMAAITKPYASLLINAPNNPNILKNYINDVEIKDAVFSDGLKGLKRLITSNLLTPESLPDYAERVINKKLDVILGSHFDENQTISIIKNAMDAYEYVWMDLKNGENEFAEYLLSEADHLLIHLPQDLQEINENWELLKEKFGQSPNVSFVIGKYDPKASLTAKNVKRKLKIKREIFSMSYSTTLKNALNENKLTEELLKTSKQEPYTDNSIYVKDSICLLDEIIRSLSDDREAW